MRVWVQPDQLSARSLTAQDVEGAINARNVEIPAGRIESTRREFSVRSLGELKTPREFGELVVASQGGQLVKLKDVANVELGPEDNRSIFRYNGRSEERRVGKECRSRGSPYHYKKKKKEHSRRVRGC